MNQELNRSVLTKEEQQQHLLLQVVLVLQVESLMILYHSPFQLIFVSKKLVTISLISINDQKKKQLLKSNLQKIVFKLISSRSSSEDGIK